MVTVTKRNDPTQVESLDALAQEAASVDGQAGAPGAPPLPGAPEVIDAASSVVATLKLARDTAAAICEAASLMPAGSIAAIWSDPVLQGMAPPLMAIGDRHGDQFRVLMDKFGPYVGLCVVVAMPAIQTVKTFRANRPADVSAKVVPAAPAPDSAPSADGQQ